MKLAVLGGDVSRSLSPLIHHAAAKALGLELEYEAISCPTREDFLRAIDALERAAVGANVTIPYKHEAYARATILTATAKEIGAVNTLTFLDGAIEGENTDGPALEAIFSAMPRERLARVQLLGAGGASRAAAWALVRAGAKELAVCGRKDAPYPLAPIAGATLVVSALPPDPAIASEALASWIDVHSAPEILDLAYSPSGSPPLVAQAKARGFAANDGRAMLVEQGARSFHRWTGKALSLIREAMHDAMSKSLALYTGSGDR